MSRENFAKPISLCKVICKIMMHGFFRRITEMKSACIYMNRTSYNRRIPIYVTVYLLPNDFVCLNKIIRPTYDTYYSQTIDGPVKCVQHTACFRIMRKSTCVNFKFVKMTPDQFKAHHFLNSDHVIKCFKKPGGNGYWHWHRRGHGYQRLNPDQYRQMHNEILKNIYYCSKSDYANMLQQNAYMDRNDPRFTRMTYKSRLLIGYLAPKVPSILKFNTNDVKHMHLKEDCCKFLPRMPELLCNTVKDIRVKKQIFASWNSRFASAIMEFYANENTFASLGKDVVCLIIGYASH